MRSFRSLAASHVFNRFTAIALSAAGFLHCSGDGKPEVNVFDAGSGAMGGAAGSAGAGGSGGSGAGIVIDSGPGDAQADAPDGDAGVEIKGCGDGKIQPGEACDDGNSAPGDGCSANCKNVEANFACPEPGKPCVSTVVCGDGKVTGQETCDDLNAKAGDGCSDKCVLEPGWKCPTPGAKCEAAKCGDGIIAGKEECEDDDTTPTSGDGCSATCKIEPGHACGPAGQACHKTVCNDGKKEGDEPCDDGNSIIGDGCNPFCEVEPNCSAGACVSACGDGLILPGDAEECDDGNTKSGDGCSSSCKKEAGFSCTVVTGQLPAQLKVPVVFRDKVALPAGGSTRHPDFEFFSGSQETKGLVQTNLNAGGKPVFAGICSNAGSPNPPCPYGQQLTTAANFAQWYTDVAGVNVKEITKLTLNKQPNNTYFFPDATFFPLDAKGWVAQGKEAASGGHNFGFTSEIRYWFEYKGGETLNFSGDDDVWVFIAGKLALDLGGLHPQRSGSFTINAALEAQLGLTKGKVYEIALFHAERHTNASNFNLTLGGFVSAKSQCVSVCGDAIVTGDETCDDGKNDGSYGSCMPNCTPGPRCGDATTQNPPEQCDDGTNLTTYSTTGSAGCAPGCMLGSFCGDAKVDSLFGEQCDDGVNAGGYNGCEKTCVLGPRCGDGTIQSSQGEQCDDGNSVSGDGCSDTCALEGPK